VSRLPEAASRWHITSALVTICLQPQMKKYRSLWWMSTTNHNILYFACNPCISLLNTAICLWISHLSLARCGFL
jgi:hypothetical protein